MVTVVFWLLHAAAALFLWPALFVTVPAHLVVAALRPRPAPEPAPEAAPAEARVACPRCQQPAPPRAHHCRACGCALPPPA
jgi:uncharacterized paraquat-inducible protein A